MGFAQADHPLFDIFFGRDELVHPKAVYRPGNTVITHFLPFEHPLKTLDVTPEGLDRHKCHEYCRTLEMAAPSQEACGRCWLITELD
jgi:hypothetical protein